MNFNIYFSLKKNFRFITKYYKKLITMTKGSKNIGRINEWIVDNYYIINEQEKYLQEEIYSREIRKIKPERKKELYAFIHRHLKETDYDLDVNKLFNKLNRYQKENNDYFSYVEINFIHMAIRLILIEGITTLTRELDIKLEEKLAVEKLFDKIEQNVEDNPELDINNYIEITEELINKPYYVEQLNYKLRELGGLSASVFVKINEIFNKNHISLKEVINESHSDAAKENFLMKNLFSTLKKFTRYKIDYLYRNISYVEKVLISENIDIYDKLYDNNKIDYRNKIIKGAFKKGISEYEFACNIVEKANENKEHIGVVLFKEPNYNKRARIYIATIAISAFILTGIASFYMGTPLFFLLLIGMSRLVIEIIGQVVMKFVRPKTVFKLKFRDGLPKEYSTMVTIATLIQDKNKVSKMFEALEVYYLSNKTDNLYFALLGDCSSEDVKHVDKDKEIIEEGLKRVNELNEKYGKKIFYFAYRNRFYSNSEECYLGYERKRGGLIHFNQLILNKLSDKQKNDYFNAHTFDGFDVPIKYVITLDVDTKLVLNTALKLIGAMAHPMNKAVLSENKDRVIKGYGFLQPRIGIDVEVTSKSLYSQLFAGLGGLDIYITACFDLYQDLFGEGSFVGKGIYDVEVFDQVLRTTFPEDLILSHDLIESNYLRSGFINDVELFDDYPSTYVADSKRHHRWNRGDWQIIGWLKNKVRNIKGEVVKNPVTILGKWKIFDNLRRSLVSVSLLLTVFYGFSFGKVSASWYLLLVSIIITIPIFFYLLSKLMYRNKYDRFLKYYLNLVRGVIAVINKSFIVFMVLPYEAQLYIDSIVRALYRMHISKKNLLNWIVAEDAEKMFKNTLASHIKNFKINYVCAFIVILLSYIFKPNEINIAIIIGFVWLSAPFLIYYVSQDLKDGEETKGLDEDEKKELKDVALDTWKYFDDLIKEEYNYLIPDNYQYNRNKKVDYKTSPTNISFSLVAVISALKLNIINEVKATNLIANIIRSIEKLEKWHGHLYNWYNIHTMKKMYPGFVSSVDNGNLLASLYVVKSFAVEIGNRDLLNRTIKLIDEIDLTKLYNKELDVFSVGYNVSEQELLTFHYNNFASESRLTSFIAIAKGDAPYKHWFSLDKTLTKYKYYKGVASWGGSAFEYFMPLIFMKTYDHTLLDETYYFAYYASKEFMKTVDPELPWGVSESAYNRLDDSENYKYDSFGIPYLRFQESPSYRVVISPYSSIMALGVNDNEVYNNVKKMKKLNMYGNYGFYEAYDHNDNTIIKAYYAHHQGMILASLTNYLKDNIIQEYFHQNKNIRSIEILLKEKVQVKTYIDLKTAKYKKYQYKKEPTEYDAREYNILSSVPEVGLLSNGFYSTLLNDRGVGFSKYKNLQINRYRQVTDENYGLFVYIRNLNNDKVWSNTNVPIEAHPGTYKVVFASDRIKYIREDSDIVTTTEVTVTKDHNAELRRITFKNESNKEVTLEVTSYGEVIMARNDEDIAHRVFNGMTIHSEFDKETASLIFNRKSKTKTNTRYFIINRLFSDDEEGEIEFDTSRHNFLGRNNSVNNPDVIVNKKPLSNTVGAVLDPIMSIRKTITIKPRSKKSINLLVGFGKSKEQVKEIVSTYKDDHSVKKAFEVKTVWNNMRNNYADLSAKDIRLYNQFLKHFYEVIPISSERRKLLEVATLSRQDIWKVGVSGDWPIALLKISKIEDLGFIKEVLKLYEFYKSRAIYIDILIINAEKKKKQKIVSDYIDQQVYRINSLNYFENTPGGVYTISSDKVTKDDEALLKRASIVSLDASSEETLEQQILKIDEDIPEINQRTLDENSANLELDIPKDVDLYNGYGGFINEGKEYFVNGTETPLPWTNVVANRNFGSIISNNFSSFTFFDNSREFKLTSWSNDFVKDPNSELIVINNKKFKPTFIRHGFGYTTFYTSTKEFDIFIKLFVGKEKAIKFYEINITNKLSKSQKIVADFISKLVLGVSEELTHRHLLSKFDKKNNCLYVKNTFSDNFKNTKVFLSSTETINKYDDKSVEAKSISVEFDINEKESKVFSFMIGALENINEVNEFKDISIIDNEYKKIRDYWDQKLSTIKVNTPDKSFNYMINGWYQYQTIASRLYAKAGFYQVGGAIGFRDQLQDILSVIYTDKELARNQILKHANHQFKEGDVLHWWHEELKFGSRTKFSDDYLWLVYVTSEYIKITGDYKILDEPVGFVEGPALTETESEKGIYYNYNPYEEPLYNHLKLCINKALKEFGNHDLPLMGSGDWNDGMNKVGCKGKGESVFVGFFLYDILGRTIELSKQSKDKEFVKICETRKEELKKALNKNAWDGSWYLRAFFDNGVPLGSRNNKECQIDILSQSWSIISGVAEEDKKESIFEEVENKLVDNENKLIRLLTPPFKETNNDPGYIKDYPIGIRENGSQYTHAALWYILALLKENKIDKAYQYYQMINPVNRALTKEDVLKYKVEPYVVAADIYTNPLHKGRGGWTWYTGSASWAYKIGLENILGFTKRGDTLIINPKIDSKWDQYTITYKYQSTIYNIIVNNKNHLSKGLIETKLDGHILKDNIIKLTDDGKGHEIVVTMKEGL